jgi:primosomal protein N' (replication factor Y)
LKLKKFLSKYLQQEILGPVNAPIFKINKKFRCRLLLRVPKNNIIQKKLILGIKKIKLSSRIKLTVDVDPISFN